jgi:hypothetical protein
MSQLKLETYRELSAKLAEIIKKAEDDCESLLKRALQGTEIEKK